MGVSGSFSRVSCNRHRMNGFSVLILMGVASCKESNIFLDEVWEIINESALAGSCLGSGMCVKRPAGQLFVISSLY